MAIAQTLAELPSPVGYAGSDERKARRRIAEALALQGMDTSPVKHWTQGAARVAQALVGGHLGGELAREERTEEENVSKLLAGLPGLDGASVAVPSGVPRPAPTSDPRPSYMAPVTVADASAPANFTDRFGQWAPGAGGGTQPAPPPPNPAAAPTMNAGIVPASIRTNNPGAQYPGPSAMAFGSTGHDVIGGGHKIARFNSPEEGAAAQFDLLARNYSGMPLSAAIHKWSGGNSAPQYVQMVSRATGLSPDTVITPELLRSPQGVQLVQAMAQHEAGRPFPMSPEQWQTAQVRAFAGGDGAAMPPGATPTQGALPGQPQAPSAGAPQIDPASAQYIRALMANPRTRQYGMQLYNSLVTKAASEKPTWGKVRTDPTTGADIMGFIDTRRGTVNEYQPSTRSDQPPGAIQAEIDKIVAAGGDPKTARTEITKRAMGEALPQEAAGRLALMDTATKGLPQARKVFEREWGAGDLGKSLAARAGVGSLAGDVGEARRTVRSAIESALRVMTGAAAPESEVSRYEDLFMPNEADSPQSAKQKLDLLESFMTNARTNVMQGRALPGAAQPAQQQPAPAAAPSAPTSQATRTIGGKTYTKIDGQWYEQ